MCIAEFRKYPVDLKNWQESVILARNAGVRPESCMFSMWVKGPSLKPGRVRVTESCVVSVMAGSKRRQEEERGMMKTPKNSTLKVPMVSPESPDSH